MTFYGDNFRNMLGLEKANDLGDLTIKFEKDELCSTREYYYEFPKLCSLDTEADFATVIGLRILTQVNICIPIPLQS